MSGFDSGVTDYVYAQVTVNVAFPVDGKGKADVSCRQCPFYRVNSHSCALNNEICEYPDKYVGSHCPLEIVDRYNINEII